MTTSRNIIVETLVWNCITVQVSFEADWLGLAQSCAGHPYAHLEVQVLEPKGAPLPITDTGYWSHFADRGEVEEAGGPAAVILDLLEELSETKTWRVRRAKWEQGDLFA